MDLRIGALRRYRIRARVERRDARELLPQPLEELPGKQQAEASDKGQQVPGAPPNVQDAFEAAGAPSREKEAGEHGDGHDMQLLPEALGVGTHEGSIAPRPAS